MGARDERRLAESVKAVSDTVRLGILSELGRSSTPVRSSELAEALNVSTSRLSYHLGKLREAGLVRLVAGAYALTELGKRVYRALSSIILADVESIVVTEGGWLIGAKQALPGLERKLGHELPPDVYIDIAELAREVEEPLLEITLAAVASYLRLRSVRGPVRNLARLYGLTEHSLRRRVELDSPLYSFRHRRVSEILDALLAQYALVKLVEGGLSDLVKRGLVAWRRPESLVKGSLSLAFSAETLGGSPWRLASFLARLSQFVGEVEVWGLDETAASLDESGIRDLLATIDSIMAGPGRVNLVLRWGLGSELVLRSLLPKFESISVTLVGSPHDILTPESLDSLSMALKSGFPVNVRVGSYEQPSSPVIVLSQVSLITPVLVARVGRSEEPLFEACIESLERIMAAIKHVRPPKSLLSLVKEYLGAAAVENAKVGLLGIGAAFALVAPPQSFEARAFRFWETVSRQFNDESVELTVVHKGDEPYRALAGLPAEGLAAKLFNTLSLAPLTLVSFENLVEREATLQSRGLSTEPTIKLGTLPPLPSIVGGLVRELLERGLRSFSLVSDFSLCISCGDVNRYEQVLCSACRSSTLVKYISPFGYLLPEKMVSPALRREYKRRPLVPPSWFPVSGEDISTRSR